MSLSTACSTSLVAVDAACTAINEGKCEMAVAGGVSITFHDNDGYTQRKGMILSPDGSCRAFDKKAQGTVGGNGAGAIVLKSLNSALQDRDNIYAVIKSTATNNDGSAKVGFTAPSPKGQAEVIRQAIERAHIPAESISYVETHGTGTVLGDPIEILGLSKGFDTSKRQFCALGSVKTNFGHLDTAAGIAGLLKTVLSLKHKELVPSLHFEEPNPDIDFDNSPFYVNTEHRKWQTKKYPLRAGVSSFGIGGTNAHVILEETPHQHTDATGRPTQLMTFSSKTPEALKNIIKNFQEYLQGGRKDELADMAYTLNKGRKAFEYRTFLVARSEKDILSKLNLLQEKTHSEALKNNSIPELAFMFSGQSSQYPGMFHDLYDKEPYFKLVADQCFDLLQKISGEDFRVLAFKEVASDGSTNIDDTKNAQPLLFTFEYALAKLLMHWGIVPKVMIGHSIGEYVAACIAEVFSLDDALLLVYKRGKYMAELPEGSMLGVRMGQEALKSLIEEENEIDLAAVNGKEACVVSGPHQAMKKFEEKLKNNGVDARPT